jgi:hypothetical protein
MYLNTEKLRELGASIRKEAAVSSNNALEADVMESGLPETLRNYEMSVIEEDSPGRDNDTPMVAETLSVDRSESQLPRARAGRRR